MKTHTPLPWKIQPAAQSSTKIPKIISDSSGGYVAQLGYVTEGNREANAAFIVRACNAHAELVAALERFVGYADQHSHTEVLDEIATQARAALEKAGRGVEGGGA